MKLLFMVPTGNLYSMRNARTYLFVWVPVSTWNSLEGSVTRTNSWPRFVASINGLAVVGSGLNGSTPLFPYYIVKDSVGPTNLFLLLCATDSFVYLFWILNFSLPNLNSSFSQNQYKIYKNNSLENKKEIVNFDQLSEIEESLFHWNFKKHILTNKKKKLKYSLIYFTNNHFLSASSCSSSRRK